MTIRAKSKPKRKAVASRQKPRLSRKKSDYFDKLYLMERVSKKSFWAWLLGLHEIKIGVTGTEVENRRFGVDESLPGNVVVNQYVYKPGKVYREEQRLHRKYSDKAWRPRTTGSGAGPTEWLMVDGLTYSFILLDFWEFRNRERLQLLYLSLWLAFAIWVWIENHDEK